MSKENVEGVLRAYEQFNRGEVQAALERFHPEVVWEVPDIFPEAQTVYHGHEGVRLFWSEWQEVFPTFRIEIHEAIDAGEQVIVMAQVLGRGRDSGADVSSPSFPHVWTIRDGLAVAMKMLPNRATALSFLGLSEEAAERGRMAVPPILGSGVHFSE